MMNRYGCGMAVALAVTFLPAPTSGADGERTFSVGIEVGRDVSAANGQMARLIVQKPWKKSWWENNYWELTGLWEFSVGVWESDQEPPDDDLLYDAGITPVFRLVEKGYSGIRWFLEVGIGVHYISEKFFGDRDLSTDFQFGDHLGAGWGFGPEGRYVLAYRYQHVSNGSISGENEGIDIQWVHASCAF
jgi:lipid A 3-O-deacylase